MKVIETSLRALGWGSSPLGNIMVYDAMRLYSHCDGEWNEYFQNYKWHKLGEACRRCGINIDLPLHDAMSDVIMTDRLIHWIAKEAISDELDIFV
jgi:hydrogenase maturation factor HypF (carbamoyltransferase family)